jgi:hypothetical protein
MRLVQPCQLRARLAVIKLHAHGQRPLSPSARFLPGYWIEFGITSAVFPIVRYASHHVRNFGWIAMDISHVAEHFGTVGGVAASFFVVATCTMRTMIPLRAFGMLANLMLMITALPLHNFLQFGLHAGLFCLNGYRLHQMLLLVREVKKSVNSDLSMDWLKPFMTKRKCKTGEMLFYKN